MAANVRTETQEGTRYLPGWNGFELKSKFSQILMKEDKGN